MREALTLANADGLTDDRIEFATSIQGQTIVLGGSQLLITSGVTIDGGDGVTIDAAQASRVFLMRGFSDVRLEHLTITGGRFEGFRFDDGGGGICAERYVALALYHCYIVDNTVTGSPGGGIFGSQLSLTDSTVSRNVAIYYGFGDAVDTGLGGGIAGDYGSSISLTNSTISGNSAYFGAGIFVAEFICAVGKLMAPSVGNVTTDSGAYGNGIEVRRHGTFVVANSIIADRVVTTELQGPGPRMVSNGHNIFGSDVAENAPSDLENVPPELVFAGGLADHGGPTPTLALRDAPDNPALGGADPASAPATDQRGVSRPLPGGSNPDIGAFELDQSGPVTVIDGTATADHLTRHRRRRHHRRPRRRRHGCRASAVTMSCSAASATTCSSAAPGSTG